MIRLPRHAHRPAIACAALAAALFCAPLSAAERQDIVIGDFEGPDYGAWRVEGQAFGTAPAKGTLPNQMKVDGFLGHGLANSFVGGDATTGKLTSPPFKVERRYLNFLIGGGHHPTETCINLLVGGKVVRSSTGRPAGGGNEHLDWQTWDVRDLADKQAVVEIVDRHKGGWGHINVDQIVESDRRLAPEPASREIDVAARYLNLPVRTGAEARHVRLVIDGKTVREFDIELAEAPRGDAEEQKPSLWAVSDLAAFAGKKLHVEVDALPPGSQALEAVSIDDEPRSLAKVYEEPLRPQFHFTSQRGWLNDPNGLVYSGGKWHLFYQHNPYGWNWGNMHWGHAISDDLFEWREQPIALYPRQYGDWCFSGSAVVDEHNTSGFKTGDDDLLVLAYTSTGRGECIAYSNDAGRTWTEYAENPVVSHTGRDPKLVWHAPTKKWVMAVYDETDGKRWIAFYTSPDLKKWDFASRIEGFFECPDLFALEVDDDTNRERWVLYGADGRYMLGQFDGRKFTPESGKHQLWYGNFYAAQTFSNAPDDRRVQIGWGQGITFPGMPFNQQMTVPVELSLRTTTDGARMFAWPVEEIESLRSMANAFADVRVAPGDNPLEDISGELLDIEAEIEPGDAEECGFVLRGQTITYNAKRHEIECGKHKAPLAPSGGVLRLRLLVDRGSIEIFGNSGQIALSSAVTPDPKNKSLSFFARGGNVQLRSLTVYELRSAW